MWRNALLLSWWNFRYHVSKIFSFYCEERCGQWVMDCLSATRTRLHRIPPAHGASLLYGQSRPKAESLKLSCPTDWCPALSHCSGSCCCCLVARLCPTLCDPMGCSPPGSSVRGISQVEYWSGWPLPSPSVTYDGYLKQEFWDSLLRMCLQY